MYKKEDIGQFKCDLKDNMKEWAIGKVDALCQQRPRLKNASVYIKRGISNWLAREEENIDAMIDNALLFITDEDGNINTDVIINDLITCFKDMDVSKVVVGGFTIEYGAGMVNIYIPHNPLFDIVFGDLGMVSINADDLLEMKSLFENEV